MKTYTRKDFEKHENFCLYPFVQLYGDSTQSNSPEEKFMIKPCCITNDDNPSYASSLDNIFNHDYLKNIRKTFMSNKIPSGVCDECIFKEKSINKNKSKSKRIEALSNHPMYYNDEAKHPVYHNIDFVVEEDGTMISDFQDLDIRPSNICNLKCIMCNPWYSSKWYEDFDIYNETFIDTKEYNTVDITKKSINLSNKQTDWEWLYTHASKLKRVFIAGGEPFFMKESRDFLKHLVDNDFSSNIVLEITTNATIVDDALISLLKSFKDNCITISLDGVNEVNHIIRYPTDWNKYCSNIDLLCNEFNNYGGIVFSTVITAMNLPDAINMLNFTSQYDKTHNLSRCVDPEMLSINSLKPDIIKKFEEDLNKCNTISSFHYHLLKKLIDDYSYNDDNNNKIKQYLKSLDKARNTDSTSVLPWCWI